MVSVPFGKPLFILVLFALLIGCLGSVQVATNDRNPVTLIESARINIVVADQYVLEDKTKKATEVLEKVRGDLEASILQLNATMHKIEIYGIEKASLDIGVALDALNMGETGNTDPYLDIAGAELLWINDSLNGVNNTVPSKYTVEMWELPMTYYGVVDDIYIGYQVVPHTVAVSAREAFYTYLETGDEERLDRGIFLVEYLMSTATEKDGASYVVWVNNFAWPVYNLSSGWIGSLSQAGCIKALMLAYQTTGEERYLDFAERAITAFNTDVSDGGLRVVRKHVSGKYVWYPEYAKPTPPYVLNGFITTVIWLWEYQNTVGSEKANNLHNEGLKSIIRFLPTYDYGGNWSYYDAEGHTANVHYHYMHVEQMKTLYELTGEDIFRGYEERWSGAAQ